MCVTLPDQLYFVQCTQLRVALTSSMVEVLASGFVGGVRNHRRPRPTDPAEYSREHGDDRVELALPRDARPGREETLLPSHFATDPCLCAPTPEAVGLVPGAE